MMLTKQPKPRKCKSCGGLFRPFSTTAKACSMACALDLAGKETKKKIERQNREQKKAFLDNDKSFQRAKAQKVFNEFIRLRDAADKCISCEREPLSWNGQWHCGHFKTVGSRPDLRFDERNANKQCSICNNYLSGNLATYAINLINKIGADSVKALDFVGEPKKYTAQDYKAIHEHYKAKIKQLKVKQ